jgi:hypothetical protein
MSYPNRMLYIYSETEGYANNRNTASFNLITPVDVEFAPNETKVVDMSAKVRGFDIYTLQYLDSFYATPRTILATETPLTAQDVAFPSTAVQVSITMTNNSAESFTLIAGTVYFQIKNNLGVNFGARMVDVDHISMT